VFTLVLEDLADMAGLIIAFLGVFLSHQLHLPWIDGAASIGVGLVLASVAVLLISESRELLIGERASPAVLSAVKAAAELEKGLTVQRMLTMHLGPDEILLVLDVTFTDELSVTEASHAFARIQDFVQERTHIRTHVYVESRALRRTRPADA
jgi:divalent metal cation (Fe/Co/Zn/Cd) transporter